MASTIRVLPADNGIDRFTPDAYRYSIGATIAAVPAGGGRVYGELLAVDVEPDGASATLELDTNEARRRNDLDQMEIAQP